MLQGGPNGFQRRSPSYRAEISPEAVEAASRIGPLPDTYVIEVICFLLFNSDPFGNTFIDSRIGHKLDEVDLNYCDILKAVSSGVIADTQATSRRSVHKYTIRGPVIDYDFEIEVIVCIPKILNFLETENGHILAQEPNYLISDVRRV